MKTAQEIAAGLTKAQREALQGAFVSAAGGMVVRFIRRGDPRMPTVEVLARKGLGTLDYGASVLMLNELGLEGRSILMAEGER